MPRRSAATIRPIEPDARNRNRLVQQLINKVMVAGKTAEVVTARESMDDLLRNEKIVSFSLT